MRATSASNSPIIFDLFEISTSFKRVSFPPLTTHFLAIITAGQATGFYQLSERTEPTPVVFQPGSSLFLHVGQASTWSLDVETLELLVAYISPEHIYETLSRHGLDPRRFPLRNTLVNEDPVMHHLGLSLAHTLANPPAERRSPLTTSITGAVLLRILLHHGSDASQLDDVLGDVFTPELSTTLRTYVRQHLDEEITVHDLAQAADMSPSHFSRLFKEATGQPPYQYVLQERIKEAQRLLQESEASIAEVALRTGFSNQSHLTRRFRKVTGTTSAVYRRAVQ